MAEQMGILPLRGTIGNLNFFKLGDRYFARGKGGVSADRFAIDPKFQRSRESSNEFGTAAKAGRLLRRAFQEFVRATADKPVARRLTCKMITVLQSDKTSVRGKRKVTEGEVAQLVGFEFNEQGKLSVTFTAPYNADINRETGEMKVIIPPFVAEQLIDAPPGATHFKLISGGAELDFEKDAYKVDVHRSSALPLKSVPTDEIVFNNVLPANSTLPLFLVFGIQFFQEVNGSMYSLKDISFNGLAVVKVSGGR